MAAPTQVDSTKSVLKELFALWDSHGVSYRDVVYSIALLRKPEDGTWRNILTFFLPRHKSHSAAVMAKHDYHDFTIEQGLLSLEDAKAALTEIVEHGKLVLPGVAETRLVAFLYPGSSRHFSRSDARNYPVGFPFFDYRFTVDQSCTASPPSGAVWVPTLPLYPSGRVAIEDLLHTHLGDDRSYEGVLSVLVPDYRGKISEIRLLNNGISVHVVCPHGEQISALRAKLFSEDGHGSRLMKDLKFDNNGSAFVETTAFPRQLVVILFAAADGELIDERVFDAQLPFRPADLTIAEVGQTVENLIRGGESDAIEFKSQIPQRQEAIAATAVAFANQNGGKIFIGVENDGQIVGFSAPGARDTLTNILRDRCEPSPQFEIEEVTVLGKNLIVVTVFDGKDKPYQVREKGFYLRMQGTNRLMTRYELDEIYRSKASSSVLGLPALPEY